MFERLILFSLMSVVGTNAAAEDEINFNQHIRPILSGKCFACHGPDEKGREANLRLDMRESAIADHGGIRPGMVYGETDDFSYNIVRDGVHVYDLQATMMHCMGIDHKRLTFKHQGRDYRLTDVHGNVIKPLLA
mgnify:CR=1 FL=1